MIKNEGEREMYLLWVQAWLRLRLARLPSTDSLCHFFCFLFHSPSVIQSVQGTQITHQARREWEGGRNQGEKRETDT